MLSYNACLVNIFLVSSIDKIIQSRFTCSNVCFFIFIIFINCCQQDFNNFATSAAVTMVTLMKSHGCVGDNRFLLIVFNLLCAQNIFVSRCIIDVTSLEYIMFVARSLVHFYC